MANDTGAASETRIGRLRLRPATCEVVDGDQVRIIEPLVMRVLAVLADASGRVVPRQELVDRCWSGRAISEDAINRIVSLVRKLGSETGAFSLRTVRKVGYRLEAQDGASADAPISRSRSQRAWMWIAASLGLLAIIGLTVFGVQRLGRLSPPRSAQSATVALLPMAAIGAEDQAMARRLDGSLRAALSRMRGLKLRNSGSASAGAPTDVVLSGVVSGGATGRAALVLTDARTGEALWSSEFDATPQTGPIEERATSASVRFLAGWLGDRADSKPPAREPPRPDALRLVQEARQAMAEGRRARARNDWPGFKAKVDVANAHRRRALELDPNSLEVIKLAYDLDSWPQYPRLGEDQAAFEARMARARRRLAQALAIGPDDTDVLIAAAEDHTRAFQWDAAERMYQRALALDPDAGRAHAWYAYLLSTEGRCAEGLAHARAAAAVGQTAWEQQIIPRLLLCDGQTAQAWQGYREILKRERGNVVLLREIYLSQLAWRDAKALRELRGFVHDTLWAGAPPLEVSLMLTRIDAGVAALEGRPSALQKLLEAEQRDGSRQARFRALSYSTSGDAAFVRGLEYASAQRPAEALAALRAAVAGRSLYLPWMLPCGPAELGPPLRNDAAYAGIWRSDPGLAQLIARRREAIGRCGADRP